MTASLKEENDAKIEALKKISSTSRFASDLCTRYDRFHCLSPKQWACVENMLNPKQFPTLLARFSQARTCGVKPRLVVVGPSGNLELYQTSEKGRDPGSINITNGERYGKPDYAWYGAISASHAAVATIRGEHSEGILHLLEALDAQFFTTVEAVHKMLGYCPVCCDRHSHTNSNACLEPFTLPAEKELDEPNPTPNPGNPGNPDNPDTSTAFTTFMETLPR